jgi:hypothetical protein
MNAHLDHSLPDSKQGVTTLKERIQNDTECTAERPNNADDDPSSEAPHSIHRLGEEERKGNKNDHYQDLHPDFSQDSSSNEIHGRTSATDD